MARRREDGGKKASKDWLYRREGHTSALEDGKKCSCVQTSSNLDADQVCAVCDVVFCETNDRSHQQTRSRVSSHLPSTSALLYPFLNHPSVQRCLLDKRKTSTTSSSSTSTRFDFGSQFFRRFSLTSASSLSSLRVGKDKKMSDFSPPDMEHGGKALSSEDINEVSDKCRQQRRNTDFSQASQDLKRFLSEREAKRRDSDQDILPSPTYK